MCIFNKNKDGKIVEILKEKMRAHKGEKVAMPSLKELKVPTYFWASEDGTGLKTNKLPESQTLPWDIFEKIVKRANELGGKMYRGDVLARNGGRIGDELTDEVIDGFVPIVCEGATCGETVLSRSTYYSGILAWAGIVTIHKSQGEGSFITVNSAYRNL